MGKKPVLIFAFLAVFIFYAYFTGGIVIDYLQEFGPEQSVEFLPGVEGEIWIDPNLTGWGIPLIGFFYFSEPPCSLRIKLRDTTNTFSTIHITQILVATKKRQKNEVVPTWKRFLKKIPMENPNGAEKMSMMVLEDFTPPVIDEFADCTISMDGELISKTGMVASFSLTKSFLYSSNIQFSTFWRKISTPETSANRKTR